MFLFHNTDETSLKSILNDGYIKSLSLLQKEGYEQHPNKDDRIYETNKFIFFSCIDKMNSREIYAKCSF
jgi:hypothetical protein